MTELTAATKKQVLEKIEAGDAAFTQEDLKLADECYLAAFALLPEPKLFTEYGVQIIVARADVFFKLKNYEKTVTVLGNLMAQHKAGFLEGIIGNPYIHLRLGQAQLELGNKERAKDELARAFMGGGTDIFKDEDPKYFTFIKRFLNLDN